jgi:hypothetical protein
MTENDHSSNHNSIRGSGSVSTLSSEESAVLVNDLKSSLEIARNEINSLKAQMAVSQSSTRYGRDSIGPVVRKPKKTTEEKAQVGEIRNVLKGIMIEYIFPREKFQSNDNLYFLGDGSMGKFIMGKINPPLTTPIAKQNYWEGAWLIVKELLQEHRQSIAASLKKRFLKGTTVVFEYHFRIH